MGVETTTSYVCDGCKKKKERRELHRFAITEMEVDRTKIAEAKTFLCAGCEAKLHECLFPLLPDDEREKLEGIVR